MYLQFSGWQMLPAIAFAASTLYLAYRCRLLKMHALEPQRLALAVDALGWDVLWLDGDGVVTDAHPPTLRSLACQRTDLVGQPMPLAFPPDCAGLLNDLVRTPILPGIVRDARFEFESAEGRVAKIEVLLAPAAKVAGGAGGLLAFVRQVGLPQALSADACERTGQPDGQALRLARRGMNAELHNMLGLLQLCLDGVQDGLHKDYLRKAIRSAEGLRGLLDKINEYSDVLKPGSSRAAAPERLDAVGMRVAESLQEVAGKKPVLVTWRAGGGEVVCDGSRLYALLERAGAWAIAHTVAGHLDFSYTTRAALTPETLRVHLTLRITGQRSDASVLQGAKREAGAGGAAADESMDEGSAALDWALACRLAELINGTVYTKDEGEQGYAIEILFEVRVPASQAADSDTEDVWQLPQMQWGAKALVVEDNSVTRYMTREVLTRMGMMVMTASRAVEALRLLRTEQFDVVLMDVHMPDMDGTEAARLIRDDPVRGDVPIIAITGDDSAEVELLCRQAGVDEVIRKPLRADELRVLIGRYLSSRKQSEPPPATPLCESNAWALAMRK